MKFNKLVADPKKEVEGVWVDVVEGCRLKIARLGNPEYDKVMQRLTKPHRRLMRRGDLAGDLMQDIVRRTMAKTILLDWEGIEDDDNKPIEFSPGEALKLLKKSDEFTEIVLDFARSLELFQEEEKEETEGN